MTSTDESTPEFEEVAEYSQFLLPKLRSRFKLFIRNGDGSPAPDLAPIEQQVLAFDLGTEMLSWSPEENKGKYEHRTSKAVIWVEDDVFCNVMKAIRKWQTDPHALKMFLMILNGDDYVLEVYTFTNMYLDALQHSLWSYAPVEDRLSLTARQTSRNHVLSTDNPTSFDITGSVFAANTRSISMKLLQVRFEGFYHSIATEPVKAEDLF